MVEEVKRLLRLLTPIDWLAAGVVLVGLLIALVLDDAAVRLIGVSIALLGALAFFLLISQRLSEESLYSPTLRSQAEQLKTTIRQEPRSTRLIFDDFAETFASTDPTSAPPTASETPPLEEFVEDTSSVRIVGRRPRRSTPAPPAAPSAPTTSPAAEPPAARLRAVTLPEFVLTPSSAPPSEPRHAFHALLDRILTFVRAIVPSQTAALFWLDSERGLLVLECWQSEHPELFRSEQRTFPLGRDVVSQIVLDGRAEIVTELQPSAEVELLPYYRQSAGTSSFVGVPILLHARPVGVLCLDSPHAQAYTAMTVSLLGHVVLLISGLLQSYIQHYELFQQSRLWEYARSLWKLSTEPEETFPEQLLSLWAELLPAPVLVLCLYSQHQRQWRITALRAPHSWHHLRSVPCRLEQTLLGEALYSGHVQQWDGRSQPHRLHPQEPPALEAHTAYVIPLCSATHAYGALYCETPEPLLPKELELAETFGLWSGSLLEHRYWDELLRGGLWFQSTSGIWTQEGFRYRIAEELERAHLLGTDATLCALRLDRYGVLSTIALPRLRELLLTHVLPILRTHLRGCDVVGYLSEDTLGILLPGTELTQSHLWAEKVRKQIATTLFVFEQHRMSTTVSIGLTTLRQHRSREEVLRAVLTALEKAAQKGNTVIPYA